MSYAQMRDAIYGSSEATDATITLDDTEGTEIEVRALYMPSGEEVRGRDRVGAGVFTVRVGVAVRRTELTSKGVTALDELDGATIVINGETWAVKSWLLFPAPTGEAQGEVRLILVAP